MFHAEYYINTFRILLETYVIFWSVSINNIIILLHFRGENNQTVINITLMLFA